MKTLFYERVFNYLRTEENLQRQIERNYNLYNEYIKYTELDMHTYARVLMSIRTTAYKQLLITGAMLEDIYYPDISSISVDTKYGMKDNDLFMNDISVSTVRFDGEILRVFTPLTFKHDWNYSYVFNESTAIGLRKWETVNDCSLFNKIKSPFVVTVIRHVHKYSHKFADNDNKETGNVINEVVRYIGLNDSADIMNFASKLNIIPETEETGMEFIFMSRETALKHPEIYI